MSKTGEKEEAHRARVSRILTKVVEMLEANDVEGIGIVLVDSGFEVRTMYAFTSDAHYEMIAGAHLLDKRILSTAGERNSLADVKPAGSA